MIDTTQPVLIAGAGPTGMTAALELARFGLPVRIVEQAREPSTTSRAIGVQARTLELFEQRGLAASLVARGNPAFAASIYGGEKRLFRLDFEHLDSTYRYLLFVSQAETEAILRDALAGAGVTIERNVRLIALGQAERERGATAILEHASGALERVECTFVIDAEGAHSVARSTLGVPFEGKSLDDDYALGDLDVDGGLSDTDLHIFSSAHGFMGLFPMGNRRFRIIASNPLSTPASDTTPSIDELQRIYDQRSHVAARFHDLRWSSWFRINSRMIRRMRVGSIFFAGDSAHIHSPAGAQGMNTGIQDAINLAWKIAYVLEGWAKPELLDTYSDERVPVIKDVLERTEGLTGAIGSDDQLVRSVFNYVAPWIADTRFVQRTMSERMSQLAVGYRNGPLTAATFGAGRLQAGDRLPDLTVRAFLDDAVAGTSSDEATIFRLLSSTAFTLFSLNGSDPLHAEATLRDALGAPSPFIRSMRIGPRAGDSGAFDERFGTAPANVLVRPDGYIAAAAPDTDLAQLADFVRAWFGGASTPASTEADYSRSNVATSRP